MMLSCYVISALLCKSCNKKQEIIDHKNPDANNSNKALIPAYRSFPVLVRHGLILFTVFVKDLLVYFL